MDDVNFFFKGKGNFNKNIIYLVGNIYLYNL